MADYTVNDFRAFFPGDFDPDKSSDALITAKLEAATNQLDSAAFGTMYKEALFTLAAHLICISPTGKPSRLGKDGPDTVYSIRFKELERRINRRMALI